TRRTRGCGSGNRLWVQTHRSRPDRSAWTARLSRRGQVIEVLCEFGPDSVSTGRRGYVRRVPYPPARTKVTARTNGRMSPAGPASMLVGTSRPAADSLEIGDATTSNSLDCGAARSPGDGRRFLSHPPVPA